MITLSQNKFHLRCIFCKFSTEKGCFAKCISKERWRDSEIKKLKEAKK